MPLTRSQAIIEYGNEIRRYLRHQPVQLCDIRARMAALEEFAGNAILKRSTLGMVTSIAGLYYPLPERIALYRRQKEVYAEHSRKGEIDRSHDKNVLIADAFGLGDWWLAPEVRYPYGDVRLLRPIIGEVLVAASEWDHCPYPDQLAQLGAWYEELAPGGALYPSDAHLEYVARFEAFAEDIVWHRGDREYITIVNFPAPPNALPPVEWYCTQHVLRPSVLGRESTS